MVLPGELKNQLESEKAEHNLILSNAFQRLADSIDTKSKTYSLQEYDENVANIMELLDGYIQRMGSITKFVGIYVKEHNLKPEEQGDFRKLENSIKYWPEVKIGLFELTKSFSEDKKNLGELTNELTNNLKLVRNNFKKIYTTLTKMYNKEPVEVDDLIRIKKFFEKAKEEYTSSPQFESCDSFPELDVQGNNDKPAVKKDKIS